MKKYLSIAVVIIIVLLVALFFRGNKAVAPTNVESPTISTSPTTSTITASSPLNATYELDGESITLVGGTATVGRTTTEFFGRPVYGTVSGTSDTAVLYIAQETGGTGVFFYVAAATKVDGKYRGSKAVFIGDRIAPVNIRIVNGEVEVNYADRKPNEPMSADPSVGVTKYFVLKGGELVEK